MGDDLDYLDCYEVDADRDGELSLMHVSYDPIRTCDVPGDGWTVADLVRRARAHHAEVHCPVVDGEVIHG